MANRYGYEVQSGEKIGFPVASCNDLETGIVVRTPLASSERSYPAFIAYVGAKFSRSRAGMLELMGEVESAYLEGKLTPEKRLASIVNGLKHQSPGGMAHVAVSIENVPLMTAASLFRRTILHDGQEASTRYIDFASGNDLPELGTLLPEGAKTSPELKQRYADLQKIALGNYLNWFPKVYQAYKGHFQINETETKEKDALTARAYDTVRGFLLTGFKTSVVYVTNATTMQQLIGDFGADRIPGEGQLSQALLALLAPPEKVEGYYPEIKTLLNHAEPNMRNRDEQVELRDFLTKEPSFNELLKKKRTFAGLVENSCELLPDSVKATDKIIAQEILVINPALKFNDILSYVTTLNDEERAEIGRIIFSRRDRFNVPAIAGSSATLGLHFDIDLGIERDLGRHRAWERVSPIHENRVALGEIAETGFTQAAYLQIPELAPIQKGMEADMNKYYEKRRIFLEKLSRSVGREAADKVGMYLLPLAHQVDMIMNGDVRNMVYLQDMRIREGVHIDARRVIASANKQVAESDSLYRSLAYPENRVLVDDRAQFISRD
jgi:hypothetical protein